MSEGAPKDVSRTGEEPTKIIEIGGKKFEVGPNLGQMNWDDMNEKVAELNKTLVDGEKPWRVFTKEEYEELGKPIRVIWREEDLSYQEKESKSIELLEGIGFAPSKYFWSSTENEEGNKGAAYFCSTYCSYLHYRLGDHVKNGGKLNIFSVQCVREV
jgi:hypothetical protein